MTKENIKEQVMGSMPVKTAGSGNVRGSGVKTKLNPGKVTPQSQIRKIDPKQFDNRSAAVTTNTPSGGSLKAGSFGISQAGKQQASANRAEFKAKADAVKSTSTTSSDTSSSSMSPRDKFKSKFIKRDKGVGFVKRGTVAARRAENIEKNRMRAQAAAKARIEAKKKAAEMANEEITPYDMVLEYLLSTEQVATIEEANYVMMQLDEENIQEIVGTALKGLKMVGKFGAKGVPQFAALAGTAAALGPSVGKLAYKATETAGNVANKIGNFNPLAGFINKQRDESPLGGNKRVDDTRKKSGENKVGEKIYFK